MPLTAICPGSFDPITNGHIDIIKRTLRFADRVIVAICHNVYKEGYFPIEERERFIKEAMEGFEGSDKVEICVFSGLMVDFFNECGADIIVRGVRNSLEYERDLSYTQANKFMHPRLETLYMPADPVHAFVSSSIVKEIAAFGGDISEMVPACVAAAINSSRRQ